MARSTTGELEYFRSLAQGAGMGLPPVEHNRTDEAHRLQNQLRYAYPEGIILTEPFARSLYDGITDDTHIIAWLERAPLNDVHDFINRQSDVRTAQQNNQALHEVFDAERRTLLGRLNTGRREGWVAIQTHPSGRNAHLEKIAAVRLQIGDVRDTYLQSQEALYDSAAGTMVVGPGVGVSMQQRDADVRERLHRQVARQLGEVFGRGMEPWARTAFLGHLSAVVHNGKPFVIDPVLRGENRANAAQHRALLHELTAGREHLARQFMLAATSAGSQAPQWEAFTSSFDAVWGAPGAFDKAMKFVAERQHELQAWYPKRSDAAHQLEAVRLTREVLRRNPAEIFGLQRDASAAVGAAAVRSHRRGVHRKGNRRR